MPLASNTSATSTIAGCLNLASLRASSAKRFKRPAEDVLVRRVRAHARALAGGELAREMLLDGVRLPEALMLGEVGDAEAAGGEVLDDAIAVHKPEAGRQNAVASLLALHRASPRRTEVAPLPHAHQTRAGPFGKIGAGRTIRALAERVPALGVADVLSKAQQEEATSSGISRSIVVVATSDQRSC